VTRARFPLRTLRGDTTLFRLHRAVRNPWWFSSDGSGRFDPVGTGMGTCYLAARPLGEWIEVFRKQTLLAERDIADRALFAVELGRDLRLADLTSRRALAFGVTASLGANEVYSASQAFAAQALYEGYAGIRYLLRHDPAQDLVGFALFGLPGTPDSPDPSWPVGADNEIPDDLVAEAQAVFGYRVLPTP
jgi:RES domain-containing protein